MKEFAKTKKYHVGRVKSVKKKSDYKWADGTDKSQPVFATKFPSLIFTGEQLLEKAANFTEYLEKNPDNLPPREIYSIYEYASDGSLDYLDKGTVGDAPKTALADEIKEEPKPVQSDADKYIALLQTAHNAQMEQLKTNNEFLLKSKETEIQDLRKQVEALSDKITNQPATSPNEEYFKRLYSDAQDEIGKLNDKIIDLMDGFNTERATTNKELSEAKTELEKLRYEHDRFKDKTAIEEKNRKLIEEKTEGFQEELGKLSDSFEEQKKAAGLGNLGNKLMDFLQTPTGEMIAQMGLSFLVNKNPALAKAMPGMNAVPDPNYGLPGNNGQGGQPMKGTPTGEQANWKDEMDKMDAKNEQQGNDGSNS